MCWGNKLSRNRIIIVILKIEINWLVKDWKFILTSLMMGLNEGYYAIMIWIAFVSRIIWICLM